MNYDEIIKNNVYEAILTIQELDGSIKEEAIKNLVSRLHKKEAQIFDTFTIDGSYNICNLLVSVAEFFNHESCGKCVPCREGTYRITEFMRKIADGEASNEDIQTLYDLCDVMGKSCLCSFGQAAAVSILRAMKLFPEAFEKKLRKEEK